MEELFAEFFGRLFVQILFETVLHFAGGFLKWTVVLLACFFFNMRYIPLALLLADKRIKSLPVLYRINNSVLGFIVMLTCVAILS